MTPWMGNPAPLSKGCNLEIRLFQVRHARRVQLRGSVHSGWSPKNISEEYITRLVLSSTEAVRKARRKISGKMLTLLKGAPVQ